MKYENLTHVAHIFVLEKNWIWACSHLDIWRNDFYNLKELQESPNSLKNALRKSRPKSTKLVRFIKFVYLVFHKLFVAHQIENKLQKKPNVVKSINFYPKSRKTYFLPKYKCEMRIN